MTGKEAILYKPIEGTEKVVCTACARYCKVGPGQIGLCGVRGNQDGKLWLYVYGKVIAGHIDPIEKKPVTHYRPGSKIFSIATTGCNWLCHPQGVRILLQDGSTKDVRDIYPGDVLWSYDVKEQLSTHPSVVTHVGTRLARVWKLLSGPEEEDRLLLTEEHPVLTGTGWKEARYLKAGDKILRVWPRERPGVPTPIRSLREEPARLLSKIPMTNKRLWVPIMDVSPTDRVEQVYSFECNPYHNYVADGVVVHNCQYCFLPGTMVLTDGGHERIETIFSRAQPTESPEVRLVTERLALTNKGRWRRIVKAFEHLYSGAVIKVRPFYLPEIACTPDHSIFASIAGGPVQKVPASGLKIGDFVAIPWSKEPGRETIDVESFLRSRAAPPFKRKQELEIREGRVKWSRGKGSGIPSRLKLTPGIARLLGYYCAEGSVSWSAGRPNSGSVWFSFGRHEEERIREVERLLTTNLGLKPFRTTQDNRVAVVASNGSLTALLEDICGSSSDTKRVPDIILTSTEPSVLMGFLAGYFNGDGYITKARGGQLILGSSSVSRTLTYGVSQLLLTLGYMPRVYHARNRPEYIIQGRLVSRSDDHMLRLWVDEINLKPDEASWTSSKIRIIETPDYILVPIRDITEEEYVGPVYNLEVEDDHSYTANFAAVANCQNADISQRRKVEGLDATPEQVAQMALRYRSDGIAYTYNEPSIFIEYAHDIGVIARQQGLINIFVSNGYDTPDSVNMMKDFLDCITVDFKGSGEEKFVRKYIGIPNAQPIFDTLRELKEKTNIHVEITDLIVPQVGDNLDEARKLSKFVYDLFGPDMPIHFLRWHPDYKMMDLPMTPIPTLEKHCQVAKEVGLKYVYIGNVPGHPLEHTYCPGCGRIAIKRFGFDITGWNLDKDNKCKACGYQLPIVGPLADSVREDRFRPVIW